MSILDAPAPKSQKVFFSSVERADGALPATGVLDSGHPYVVTHSGATGFYVSGGGLRADVSLAYLNFGPLRGPVREFWLEQSWTDSSQATDEVGVVIICENPFANNYPTSYSNAGAHILIARDHYSFQKRVGAGPPVTKTTHYFAAPLAYGVKHRFGLLWDGATPIMVDPDGTRTVISTDSDVVDWWGAYGCYEINLGAASGTNKVSMHSFTADSEVALNATMFAPAVTGAPDSTVTSAGTTTLTFTSTQTQVFTGTTTHTVLLPSAGIKAGDRRRVNNQSTGIVTVQSSAGNTIVALRGSRVLTLVAFKDTPTAAGDWIIDTVSGTFTNGPHTTPLRDNNSNVFANNFITDKTTTVTSGGTLTMGINYPENQVFTGTQNHTVLLPTTSVVEGQHWNIINQSTGVITVQSSSGAAVGSVAAGRIGVFTTKVNTPTAATDWVTGQTFPAGESTVTAAGTTTLTLASKRTQIFTGTTTQTVLLPTTGVLAGETWSVVNNSTGIVTVQSSAAGAVLAMRGGRSAKFKAIIDSPTAAGDWQVVDLTATITNGPITTPLRDNNSNVFASNFMPDKTSTVTSAGTLTMGINYPAIQEFTGSTTHTVKLPTTSVTQGMSWTVDNRSSGAVTVQSSGANTITTVAAGAMVTFMAKVATPTAAADWGYLTWS